MDTSSKRAADDLLGNLIHQRQVCLGIDDAELATQLGFAKVLVIEMIKSGRMCLPLVKAPLLASALGLGVWEVLRVAADRPTLDFLESLRTTGG